MGILAPFQTLPEALSVTWRPGEADCGELTVEGVSYAVRLLIRDDLRASTIGSLLQQQTGDGAVVVSTRYVAPRLGEALRSAGLQFIDQAGNCFLRAPGVYVYITGNSKPKVMAARQRSGRASQPTGIKLVFHLLQDPALVAAPLREMATVAGISPAAAKLVIDDLQDKGFVSNTGKAKRRLVRTRALIDEWAVAYRDRLRPELAIQRYRADRQDWWGDAPDAGMCWGGEVAAAELGLLRNPQVWTVYRHGTINALIAAGQLRADPEGEVEVLRCFWAGPMGRLAPDLVIYGDLVTSGIERNIVCANELYERRLAEQ